MFCHLQTCSLLFLRQSGPGFIRLQYCTYIHTPAAPLRLSQGDVFSFFCHHSTRKCFVNYTRLTASFLLNPSSSSVSPDSSQRKQSNVWLFATASQEVMSHCNRTSPFSHVLAAKTGLLRDPRRRRTLPPTALLSLVHDDPTRAALGPPHGCPTVSSVPLELTWIWFVNTSGQETWAVSSERIPWKHPANLWAPRRSPVLFPNSMKLNRICSICFY